MEIRMESADARAVLSILSKFVSDDRGRENLMAIHVYRDPAGASIFEATDGHRLAKIRLPESLATLPGIGHYLIRQIKQALAQAKVLKTGLCSLPCEQITPDTYPDTCRVIPSDLAARAGTHTLAAFDPAYLEDLGAAYKIALKWSPANGGMKGPAIQLADRRDPLYCPPLGLTNGASISHVLMPIALSSVLIEESEALARRALGNVKAGDAP